MKTRISRFVGLFVCMIVILSTLPGSTAFAQDADPPPDKPITEPCPPSGVVDYPCQTEEGLWVMPAESDSSALQGGSRATGGPDTFGYTWDDTAAFSWIDASGGTDTGLSDSTSKTDSIALPFTFNYYGFNYNSLYITVDGFITFEEPEWWSTQMSSIPQVGEPNNVIAPYWAPHSLQSDGWIRYLSGGTAPNRYFVVEWNVHDDYMTENDYRFQVILYENNDFAFQYHTFNASTGWLCGIAGFEDQFGIDGLETEPYCSTPTTSTKVLVSRPSAAARVTVYPVYQGRLVQAGAVTSYEIIVANNGDLGSDTFDISVSSAWPVTLYDSTGNPLTNTDGDGVIDTGSLASGELLTVEAQVTAPTVLGVGDSNDAQITLTSSVDSGVSQTAHLQGAIPAPFAQGYFCWENSSSTNAVDFIQPSGHRLEEGSGFKPWGAALNATPNGFAEVYPSWSFSSSGSIYIELFLNLYDMNGYTTADHLRIWENTTQTNISITGTSLASTPDGHIGIAWVDQIYSPEFGFHKDVYYMVLDASGNIVVPRINLSNTTVGDPNDINDPRIIATDDNHFVIAWQQYHYDGRHNRDIFYTVRDTDNGVIKAITNQTNASNNDYRSPTLVPLSSSRFLLAFTQPGGGITYVIFDSAGNIIQSEITVGAEYSSSLDGVQLSDGVIALTWRYWNEDDPVFALIDGGTYALTHGPAVLNNPAGNDGSINFSVTADNAGQAILTMENYESNKLYYALFNSNGDVVTEPLLMLSCEDTSVSIDGYGNAPFAAAFPTTTDIDLWVTSPTPETAFPMATPLTTVSTTATFSNQGETTATSVVLTATLDGTLAYNNASPTPDSVVGNVVTWNLPDIASLAHGTVTLDVDIPSAYVGVLYPINWDISSAGTEADPPDNAFTSEVMLALSTYLPIIVQ